MVAFVDYSQEVVMFDPLELVKRSSDAAFALDGVFRVLAWNDQAEALTGISRQEAASHACYDLFTARSENGEFVCGPDCEVVSCFLKDIPFAHQRLVIHSKTGLDRLVQVSTIVLPGPVQPDSSKAIVFLRSLESPVNAAAQGRPVLKVYTLGRFRLEAANQEVDFRTWPRRQAVTLLKILVSQRGRPVPREAVQDALWPDVDPAEAAKRLKVVVHSLRRCLAAHWGEAGASYVQTEDGGYRLSSGPSLWVDVDRFQALAQESKTAAARGDLEEALVATHEAAALYQGDYLQEDRYTDWVLPERVRLQELFLDVLLSAGAQCRDAGLFEEALDMCVRGIAIDLCRESLHRIAMECLWRKGQRSEALRQFMACREALHQELGVEPMPETMALHQRILQNTAFAIRTG